MGKTLLEQYPLHACIRGEYEKGVVRVLNGESGFIDYDMLTKAEMNAAPFPWYDELHAHRYWDGCRWVKRLRHMSGQAEAAHTSAFSASGLPR